MTRPTVVDIFAGVGGLGLGFEQAGFDIVAALEIDPVHAATHAFNFPRLSRRSAPMLRRSEVPTYAGNSRPPWTSSSEALPARASQ